MLFNASSAGTCPFLIPLCLKEYALRQRHELIQTQQKRFSLRCFGYENYLTLNKKDTTISYIQSGHHLLWTQPYLLRSTVFHSWVRMPLNGPRILSHCVCVVTYLAFSFLV